MAALIRTIVAGAGLAVAAGALAQNKTTTELEARTYVLSAFISGAAHAIIGNDVVLAPRLRERLGVPANASSRAIYEALFALTEDRPLSVHGATPQEMGASVDNGHRSTLVALQAGDVRLFFQYDLERDNIACVSDGTPLPSVAASGEARAMTVAHSEAPAGFSAAPRLIRVPALHFQFDQVSLDRSALEELERASLPKLMQARYVVRGHADDIGTARYNERLSRQRAEAVRDYLVAKGADPAKIEVLALGATMPEANCPAALERPALLACLAPNRRVEVEIELP
ncbi:MAG TPA: OmpA family protein [Burkholderiales bacterium]|nr:OmpA family protein [Burkholderiales bacterium]